MRESEELRISAKRCVDPSQKGWSGHHERADPSPLLGVKRTSLGHPLMSAFDPKRTSAAQDCCRANRRPDPRFAGCKSSRGRKAKNPKVSADAGWVGSHNS